MNKEMNDETAARLTEDVQEIQDASDRRSFIKGTVLIASAVAAGGLASSAAAATPQPDQESTLQGPPAAFPRSAVASMQVVFDVKSPPTLEEIIKILPDIFGPTGCRACGLIGLDIRFGLDTILPTQIANARLILEGTLPGR
jgi:hypothetical protein